jgi:hypothetical protein
MPTTAPVLWQLDEGDEVTESRGLELEHGLPVCQPGQLALRTQRSPTFEVLDGTAYSMLIL